MNTELLREDELWAGGAAPEAIRNFAELLRGRLIEERKKNAELNIELNSLSDALAFANELRNVLVASERVERAKLEANADSLRALYKKAEAELAEARKDSERLDWLFKCQTVTLTIGKSGLRGYVLDRAAIDGAMKEYYHNL